MYVYVLSRLVWDEEIIFFSPNIHWVIFLEYSSSLLEKPFQVSLQLRFGIGYNSKDLATLVQFVYGFADWKRLSVAYCVRVAALFTRDEAQWHRGYAA